MKRVIGFAFVVLVACGSSGGSDSTTAPPATNDLPPGAPPPLDGTPVQDELTEQYGVFVTPTGSDSADGSRATPLATIAAGIKAATPNFKRVYVCTGAYKESIQLVSGISVIGGFDCSNPTVWKTGAAHTKVEAPTSPALEARNIDKATRLEAFDLVAPAGTDANPSSIALIAENAGALTVANGALTASNGKDGAPGVNGPQLTLPTSAKGGDGAQDSGVFTPGLLTIKRNVGGVGGSGACVGKTGINVGAGGGGGYGGGYQCSTITVMQATVKVWSVVTSALGVDQTRSDGAPAPGTEAVAGTDGASATATGTIAANGFTPANGTAGKDGTPGKGGDGGNGATGPTTLPSAANVGQGDNAASGAGGGGGGCPGLAGTAGTGGGASIAAIVVNSAALTFDNVALASGDGGAGGKGTLGSDATAGGSAGTSYPGAGAAQAGKPGGRAGVSGSGAGGPSYAIAASGGAPKLTNGSTTKFGKGGAGVAADSKPDDGLGNARTLPASAAGDAKDVYAF